MARFNELVAFSNLKCTALFDWISSSRFRSSKKALVMLDGGFVIFDQLGCAFVLFAGLVFTLKDKEQSLILVQSKDNFRRRIGPARSDKRAPRSNS